MNSLQRTLLDWFAANQRPLPWRGEYHPWHVLVAEIMGQQTQLERVAARLPEFLERFPTAAALAEASEEEVLKAWEGLGYYARARNLQAAAQALVERHGGEIPQDLEAVRALPGVGRYTAGAVLSQAFNLPAPIVDANVARLFARLFDLDEPIASRDTQAFLWETAAAIIPAGHAREFNQALMELGALVCGKNPRCSACPLAGHCEAHRLNIVEERPVPTQAKAIIPLEVATGVLVHRGRIFIQKRLPHGAWGGLWEFPGGRVEPEETPHQAVVRELLEETGYPVAVTDKIALVRHGYTTYKVALHCFACRLEVDSAVEDIPAPRLTAAQDARWVTLRDLAHYAFPAGHRKLIDLMERDLRFA